MNGIMANQNIFTLSFCVLFRAALLLSTYGKLQWCGSLSGTSNCYYNCRCMCPQSVNCLLAVSSLAQWSGS